MLGQPCEVLSYGPRAGSHPSLRGTYLVACLFWGAINERSPLGLLFAPPLIPDDEVVYLQNIAARALFTADVALKTR